MTCRTTSSILMLLLWALSHSGIVVGHATSRHLEEDDQAIFDTIYLAMEQYYGDANCEHGGALPNEPPTSAQCFIGSTATDYEYATLSVTYPRPLIYPATHLEACTCKDDVCDCDYYSFSNESVDEVQEILASVFQSQSTASTMPSDWSSLEVALSNYFDKCRRSFFASSEEDQFATLSCSNDQQAALLISRGSILDPESLTVCVVVDGEDEECHTIFIDEETEFDALLQKELGSNGAE